MRRRCSHQPKHPYTVGLLNCYPDVDGPRKKLESIEGVVPDLINPPSGCRFHPRCKHAMPICGSKEPQLGGSGGWPSGELSSV